MYNFHLSVVTENNVSGKYVLGYYTNMSLMVTPDKMDFISQSTAMPELKTKEAMIVNWQRRL